MTNELIHHVDENVQSLVRMGLRFRQPVHSFDQADFGLGQASHEVGDRAYRGFQSAERGFQLGEALVVLGGCGLKTGLGIQDELHGLFNVHELDYNSLSLTVSSRAFDLGGDEARLKVPCTG